MKSLIGNEEAKLVLALMHKKAEVPEDLKTKALEQLRVYSMACEPGSAKGYLLDQLIEAIEAGDADKVTEIATMASACLEDGPDYDSDDVTMDPELEEMAHDAIDNAISMFEGEGLAQENAARMLKRVMSSFLFIPLIIADGMMIGWGGEHGQLIVFGINFEGDKVELAERFNRVDGKQKIMPMLCRQFDLDGEIEVGFAALKLKRIDDDTIELYARSL